MLDTNIKISKLQSICKEAPFSDEPDAISEAESCDYSTKITQKMAKSGKGGFTYLLIHTIKIMLSSL